MFHRTCLALLFLLLPAYRSTGDLMLFHGTGAFHDDFPDLFLPGFMLWEAVVQDYNAIDFGGFVQNTIITDQYADLGIHFTNPAFTQESEDYSGGGRLVGPSGIRVTFDTPQHAIGVKYWGVVSFALFMEGDLVGVTNHLSNPNLSPIFAGVISDQAFDEVWMFTPSPPFSSHLVTLDNLYWGAPIPVPGALGLLAVAALGLKRRRRQ